MRHINPFWSDQCVVFNCGYFWAGCRDSVKRCFHENGFFLRKRVRETWAIFLWLEYLFESTERGSVKWHEVASSFIKNRRSIYEILSRCGMAFGRFISSLWTRIRTIKCWMTIYIRKRIRRHADVEGIRWASYFYFYCTVLYPTYQLTDQVHGHSKDFASKSFENSFRDHLPTAWFLVRTRMRVLSEWTNRENLGRFGWTLQKLLWINVFDGETQEFYWR